MRTRIVTAMCPRRCQRTLAHSEQSVQGGRPERYPDPRNFEEPNIPLITRKRIELDDS